MVKRQQWLALTESTGANKPSSLILHFLLHSVFIMLYIQHFKLLFTQIIRWNFRNYKKENWNKKEQRQNPQYFSHSFLANFLSAFSCIRKKRNYVLQVTTLSLEKSQAQNVLPEKFRLSQMILIEKIFPLIVNYLRLWFLPFKFFEEILCSKFQNRCQLFFIKRVWTVEVKWSCNLLGTSNNLYWVLNIYSS